MSNTNETILDIEYLLKEGKTFAQVARELEVPIRVVVEVSELSKKTSEDCSPYATINS